MGYEITFGTTVHNVLGLKNLNVFGFVSILRGLYYTLS